MAKPSQPPPHGVTRYRRWKCRCPVCKKAQAEAVREFRKGGKRATIEHGTRGCYVHNNCRQPECVQANNDYQRSWMRLHRAGISWADPLIEEALK